MKDCMTSAIDFMTEELRHLKNHFEVVAESQPQAFAGVLSEEERKRGLQRLESAANAGTDPEAAYDYAVVLFRGEYGVAKNVPLAIKFFEKASEGGVKEATYNLGVLYVSGLHVKRDVQKGLALLEKASSLKCAEASHKLGQIYAKGIHDGNTSLVLPSYRKALEYFEQGADLNHAGSQFMCGLLAQTGTAGPEDESKALQYYERAGANGHADAACNAALMYHSGIGTRSNVAIALEWYRIASQLGDVDAKATLGLFSLYGYKSGLEKDAAKQVTVKQNIKEGIAMLQEAAQNGSVMAQRSLGAVFLGRGELPSQASINALYPTNSRAAYEYFSACARQDDNDCRSELASMILSGDEGVSAQHRDATLAFRLISKAASEGHANATLKKALMLRLGLGTKQDVAQSILALQRAASELDSAAASFFLGMAAIEGDGVPKSFTHGISYLTVANAKGFVPVTKEDLENASPDQVADLVQQERLKALYAPEKPVTL